MEDTFLPMRWSNRWHTVLLLWMSSAFADHREQRWRRGSVVRTSVFDWRTFTDLWLTCDYFVGKVSAMDQPTRPTCAAFHPSGVAKWVVIHVITGVVPLNGSACLAVRLQARVCWLSVQPIDCTFALVCDVQCYCSCSNHTEPTSMTIYIFCIIVSFHLW